MNEPYNWFDQAAVTLLTDLPAWRLRAVERVELSSAFWSERDREIHVKSFSEVTEGDSPWRRNLRTDLARHRSATGESFEMVLPITDLPKIPLLDLSITVDGNSVYRVPKDEGARIEARHVVYLAERAQLINDPPECSQHLVDFLGALFYFPTHPYQKIWEKYHHLSFSHADSWSVRAFVDTQQEYLASMRRKFPFDILHSYGEWKCTANRIGELAASYVILDHTSGAQNPLIALPYLFQEIEEQQRSQERVMGRQDIDVLLNYLCSMLETAHSRASRDAAACEFISTYFGYGYRWMAFAKCKVPVSESFSIHVKEKRAIYFSPERKARISAWEQWKKEAWQMVPFADAETNHVSVRVTDTAVRLKHRPQVLDEIKNPVTEAVDQEASTFELYLLHDSSRGRRERIYIKCPLRLTRLHSGMLYITMIITAFGFALLIDRGLPELSSMPPHDPTRQSTSPVAEGLTAKDATLILIPVAFAATFLLIRDASTLSAWLRRIRQSVLLVELFVLLASAFVFVLIHHIKIG
ncbi:hypothetical protein ABR737_19720 [Streptomyces sp. Edi2]|uniref:hypothetical protein n=1 Tax=Streptomyces sp. Edi2 TaxID=3162528 RepID=UPI003305C177